MFKFDLIMICCIFDGYDWIEIGVDVTLRIREGWIDRWSRYVVPSYFGEKFKSMAWSQG